MRVSDTELREAPQITADEEVEAIVERLTKLRDSYAKVVRDEVEKACDQDHWTEDVVTDSERLVGLRLAIYALEEGWDLYGAFWRRTKGD